MPLEKGPGGGDAGKGKAEGVGLHRRNQGQVVSSQQKTEACRVGIGTLERSSEEKAKA